MARIPFFCAVTLSLAVLMMGRAQTVNSAPVQPGEATQADSAEALRPILIAASQVMAAAAQMDDVHAMMQVATPDLMFVARPSAIPPGQANIVRCEPGLPILSNPRVRQTSPVSAVLTYTLHQTCSSPTEPADQNATDNFVMLDGTWLIALHTQTPVRP